MITGESYYSPFKICSEMFLYGLSMFAVTKFIWIWSKMYPKAFKNKCNILITIFVILATVYFNIIVPSINHFQKARTRHNLSSGTR